MCRPADDIPIDDEAVSAMVVRADRDDPTVDVPLDDLWAAAQRRLDDVEHHLIGAEWTRAERETEVLRLLDHCVRLADASLRRWRRECEREDRARRAAARRDEG